MIKRSLIGLTPEEIRVLAGSSISHAIVIANYLYKKRLNDVALVPDIPKKVKEELSKKSIPGIYGPVASGRSSDGTIKYLFRNESEQEFETVLLTEAKRITVCVSSQSGCRMGCPFCVTGRYGFRGNLSVRDIITQVLGLPASENVTHVVFMGMGEPMDNIENVLKACKILTAEWGLALSKRNITVSTVGITPGIKYFLEESDCNMALSLYSPFPEERYRIIPAEKKYHAHEIIQIMKSYRNSGKRRMSIAYIMISDINDSEKHLEGLKALVTGTGIRINLIPYNPIPSDDNISSSNERMQYFRHELVISGISASIRKSKGIDVSAACGLLASGLQ